MKPLPATAESHRRSSFPNARAASEIVCAVLGIALVVAALAANQRWLDAHFLPSFFLPRRWYVRIETFVRLALGAVGVLIAGPARPRVGRIVERAPLLLLEVVAAAALACGAGELVLRSIRPPAVEWLAAAEEPRRQPDARLGWTLVPNRTGWNTVGGRRVAYAIDANGFRVRQVDAPVDLAQPTIVFIGESVMFGEGLSWDESVPAQVGAMMRMQTANLAVHGFGNDQAYLRLAAELPRFRQPIAVVSLFMTALFGRNLDDDRPYLTPGLVWHPAERHGRVASLATLLVPFRTDRTVARGVAVTREVLRATADLARTHHAVPLVLVPQLGREDDVERALRRRIFEDGGAPAVFVEIDDSWRLPWDRHPNARAAHALAAATAERLRSMLDRDQVHSP